MSGRLRRLVFSLVLPAFMALGACASAEEETVDASEDELDYRSTAGIEYRFVAPVTFEVSAEAARLEGAERERAIEAQADAIGRSVVLAIGAETSKVWTSADRTSRKKGVAVLRHQETFMYRDLTSVAGGKRYSMKVSAEFVGVDDLEDKLPLRYRLFEKVLPISEAVPGVTSPLEASITKVERSRNAYPKYLQLFEDGLDIGIFMGDAAYDVVRLRSIYDDLLRSGFESPVRTFDDLELDSPPLTKDVLVKGQRVPVRVRLHHSKMVSDEQAALVADAYRQSMKRDDVVIYDGHGSADTSYSGVAFGLPGGRIPAATFKNIEAADKQQLYLFNACETYAGYANELYKNPRKNPSNTDVLTTGNLAAMQHASASQVIAFLHGLVDQRDGVWIPHSWDSILERMNEAGEKSWVHVYGVHGIDDDPKRSPLAEVSRLGAECSSDTDCGAPDSKCVQRLLRKSRCGIACADTSGCPTGTQCRRPRGGEGADDMQCL